ncbi:MAG: ankyrin repeat domain-containing protein [Anaerolineae bacterium]|nr:ankyrin repeat domain-containing protein [Anaerolineae bacterium]
MADNRAFFKAIQEGDVPAVEAALRQQSDLKLAKNEHGVSALLLAIYYGQRAVVELLLAQGIETSIFEAAALGQTERVEALLDESPRLLDAFSDDGFTPLGLASFFGHADSAAYLLRNGADPNLPARNPMQVRPIHSAVANGNEQVGFTIARLLLEHGAEVNVAQHGGWTPLHQAAAHGQDSVVRLLLQHGANPSAISDDGKTPLAMAQANEHYSTVALLES